MTGLTIRKHLPERSFRCAGKILWNLVFILITEYNRESLKRSYRYLKNEAYNKLEGMII